MTEAPSIQASEDAAADTAGQGPANSQCYTQQAWHITNRWQSFEGEIRCSILRIAFLTAIYLLQLLNYLFLSEPTPESNAFHRSITWLVVIWLLVSMAILIALRRRYFPVWLPYIGITFDLILLTLATMLGSSTASPLIACYFVLIAMAGLRASLGNVWVTTVGAMAGYLTLVGTNDSSWFDAEHTTPVVNQLVTLASLAASGIVMGQILRMFRSSTQDYAERVEHLEELAAVAGSTNEPLAEPSGGKS